MAYNFKETMNKPERLAPPAECVQDAAEPLQCATCSADFTKETRQ